MSKYVAFLDILGFKEKLKKLKQQDAKSFIGRFSTTAFEQWEDMSPTLVEGYYIVKLLPPVKKGVPWEKIGPLFKEEYGQKKLELHLNEEKMKHKSLFKGESK